MRSVLQKREDDFSVQYSLQSSRSFWVRVEKPFDCLKITDLMYSDEEIESAIEAIRDVYNNLGKDYPRSIIVTDILPRVQRSAAAEVPPVYDRLVKLVQSALPELHSKKLVPRLELRGTKFDISFRPQ